MHLKEIQNQQYRKLLEDFLQFLNEKTYGDLTRTNYRRTLTAMVPFMYSYGIDVYTPEVGMAYYEWYLSSHNSKESRRKAVKIAITRLNDYAMNIPLRIQCTSQQHEQLPDSFEDAISKYLAGCARNGNLPVTLRKKAWFLLQFVKNCMKEGCSAIAEFTGPTVTGACIRMNDKDSWAVIRAFLKYLCMEEVVPYDLSTLIPRYKKELKLPSIYSEEEIRKTEQCIDRNQATGIRDYAMILLATRLGMRSGDIALLDIHSLNFETNRIYFEQQKTGNLLVLPMLHDVKEALVHYIQTVRPSVQNTKVFQRMNAPYQPITTSAIRFEVTRYFKLAGINTSGKHHGPHSFRASMANSMINGSIPYEAVRNILGHTDPNAIKHYARLDIEQLRRYAVRIPAPSGAFKTFLDRGEF